MSLRLFIDQCVPESIIKTLRDAGYEVFVLGDFIPIESPERVVIAKAQEIQAILVSQIWRFCRYCRVSTQRISGHHFYSN